MRCARRWATPYIYGFSPEQHAGYACAGAESKKFLGVTLATGAAIRQIGTMPSYRIIEDDLSGAAVAALLQLHLDEMHQWSPPASVHAMPIARLRGLDVTFYTAWSGNELAACGALKQLDSAHGELKSMRAAPAYRGRGAGRAMLEHLLREAGARGYARVSLETGRPDEFHAARALYEANGFAECPAFDSYFADGFSICMTREL